MCIYLYAYVFAVMCEHTHVCRYHVCKHTYYVCTCLCICMYENECVCALVCSWLRVYMWMYVCEYLHVSLYGYM